MRPLSEFELKRLRGQMQSAFHEADESGEPIETVAEVWRDPDVGWSNADDAGFFVQTGEDGQVKAFEMPCRLYPATAVGDESEFGAQIVTVKEWIFSFDPSDSPVQPFEIRGSDTLKVEGRIFEVVETSEPRTFTILHRVRCKEIKNG